MFSAVFAAAIGLPALPAVAQSQGQQSQGQQTQGQTTSGSSAQPSTLGELAKKEAERRKAAAAQGQVPKKVYTNSDLSPAPAAPSSDSADATKDTKDAKDASDKSADKDKKEPAPEQTEKYWRKRIDDAREEMRRNEMFRDALQARINGLTADFSARDDPYQRAQIADDRQKALAELGRVNDEIEKGKKAIADIEEEARKANVPAGWVR
jgi:hypothetical protein